MLDVENKKDVWTLVTIGCALLTAVVVILLVSIFPEDTLGYLLATVPLLSLMAGLPLIYWGAATLLAQTNERFKLRALTQRDKLTQAATRDYFYERLEADPDAFGVTLMLDIDFFKRVNDTHGHMAGDAVIRQVAAVARRNCREEDIVCRFGGEEFVIFLCNARPEFGAEIAERIRLAVAEAPIVCDEAEIAVTVSIGADLKKATESIDKAIKRADAALYRAKETGRNRTVTTWAAPALTAA